MEENQFEPALPEKPELKEYGSEEGITKAISKIERLLESQKYVVIAVSGSGVDVGKTYVSSAIERELIERNISFVAIGSIGTLLTEPIFAKRRGGRVLIFEAESPVFGSAEEGKHLQNKWLKEKIKKEKLRLPISKIDIRVYVYRPDKPFIQSVDLNSADILIRNKGAFDNRSKIGRSPIN